MIIWVSRALALAIHERQLAEHGGLSGIRDESMLQSALARPQQRFAYGEPPPDVADLAASLAFGLARNHPFVDGNKRTAAVTCETFLLLNGTEIDATDVELYPQYLGLADGSVSESDFAQWLRAHLRMRGGHQVNEPKAAYR